MSETDKSTIPISVHRCRRSFVKASTTKLSTRRIRGHHAHKLDSLDSEFKDHHFAIVDAIEDDKYLDTNLAKEQDELDNHDNTVSDLSLRLENLILTCSSKTDTAAQGIASRRLTNLRERLSHASSELSRTPEYVSVIEQYREQTSDYKKELSDIRNYIVTTCSPAESNTLINITIVDLEKLVFDICLTIRKKSHKTPATSEEAPPATSSDSKKVRLPTLDIPLVNVLGAVQCRYTRSRRHFQCTETRIPQAISQGWVCQQHH